MAAQPVLSTVPAAPLAPALVAKPTVSPSPGPGTPGSITSREWVIPPRPKPGRKPATDTPPTKRKAQNRAAQRAFRERRAARVNELEDQMKLMEDDHDIHVTTFKEQISTLSREVEQCRTEMAWWRDRCHALEKDVSVEKAARETLVKEFRASLPDKNASSTDAVPLPPRTSTRASRKQSGRNLSINNSQPEPEEVPLGCNRCSTTHCQCIEDAFAMPDIEMKDSLHPSRMAQDTEPKIKPEPEEMEIDFTTRFAPSHHEDTLSSVSSPPVDPCGFCQDGTPCICAEMAAQEEQRRRGSTFENNRLAPIQNISQFTPPPSESDTRSEVTLPSLNQATNPCANGPGTCTQCLSDPRRTLFCKTLAASRSASGTPTGCCGGKGPDGGCCQTTRPPAPRRGATPPLTLSCADTFTTLSRHPNFSRASDELTSWLPKLYPLPDPQEVSPATTSRAAMEVEAASVMGVLRYFDRRFADK
ncbi:hypothetical protein BDW59DRAFT_68177 [Aspergillus cavernicola]|uniref:BZIP domain-containing protein n=1 Tax=Aspergillus cavernicola TaxID=176166 RepID=A0ABR4IDT4_9EURO